MSFPAPPSMLSAFRFPLLPLPPPQYQFHSLWVFMKFAVTFHLGGLDIKALLFPELGEQVTLPLGRTCPEGTVKVQYY